MLRTIIIVSILEQTYTLKLIFQPCILMHLNTVSRVGRRVMHHGYHREGTYQSPLDQQFLSRL